MAIRLLRVRHIGRPVLVVTLPQPVIPAWLDAVGEWAQLVWSWLNAPPPPPPIPPYLREDMGLPPDPLPRDWRGVPFHPVDPTVLHGWKR
ncbi:MAG: hypothetical protein P4M09_31265 [Devosia sp.]|nr:hypothetical protein [Devosia sp.]